MDTNKLIIRFKDLVFKPHPASSCLFLNQAIVHLDNGKRISVVGPRTELYTLNENEIGKYEIYYTDWDDPFGELTEDEIDILLFKIQKNALDLLPEMEKHKFLK